MVQGPLTELRALLAGVRRRWMAVRLLRALARLLAGLCVGLLAVLAVEVLVAPPDGPMLLVTGLAVSAVVLFAAWVLRPLRDQPADRVVARFVEERCPEFEDRVASAAELGEADAETPFQHLVVADAAHKLRTLDVGRVVPAAHLRAAVLRGGLAAVLLSVVITLGIVPIGRVARTAWLFAFPSNLVLDVEPGDVRLMAGQPLRVRVRLADGDSLTGRNAPALTVMSGASRRVIEMQATPDGYVTEFPSVRESFAYHVSAAALRSRDFRVDAMTAPRVRQVDVEYLYPEFTGRSPRVEEDGGDIYAPAGTSVRLRVHVDTVTETGHLAFSDGRRQPLEGVGAGPLTAGFEIDGDGEYGVSVTDADGLSSRGDIRYVIRTTPDRPPDVEVLRPGGDREITSLEEMRIEARAVDDYRVDTLELVYTVVGRGARAVTLDAPQSGAVAAGGHTLFAEEFDVAPGDFITYYARARDIGFTGEPRSSRSDIFFLEVRPFDNEFEAAQSQSSMDRQADEVGDLAAVQKEIIVATWRLDPQPRSTTVADDIRAVGSAQGELRTRTARAAERVLAQGRERGAGETGPAPQNAAMTAAVEAMAAAEAALGTLDTETAVPREMEALNQLLRAQAEIRRRQVSMQRGQGAQASGGQAQEDLSALFDRELRRDQETNYETSARPDQREADAASDAMRRLSALAERQAALNRQLAEQAGAREEAATEEARRLLERLTREQQELREQLEELADQLAREQRRDGQAGDSRADRQPIDRIADEMRQATSELRRQDAENARASGDRALDALRRLEQRLAGGSGGDPEATSSDPVGDAQRLADQLEAVQEYREALRRLEAALDPERASGEPSSDGSASPEGEPAAAEAASNGSASPGASGAQGGVPRAPEGQSASAESPPGQDRRPGGAAESPGADPATDDRAAAGRAGTESAPGGGQGGLDRLRRDYVAGLERNAALIDELRRENPELGQELDQWAEYWRSRSAPGAERFKLDVANWDALRQHLDTALRRFEAERSRTLAESELRDRVTAGVAEPLPARYRRLVDQYYRSLATTPDRP